MKTGVGMVVIAATFLACHSADAPPRAAAPPKPRPDGIAIVTSDDGVRVIDTIGGYEVQLPAAPKIEDKQTDTPAGPMPEIQISTEARGAAYSVTINRLPAEMIGVDMPFSDDAVVHALEANRQRVTSRDHVELGGHRALVLDATSPASIPPMVMRVATLYTPEHATLYTLTTGRSDGYTVDAAPFLASFRRTAR